jgi:hypothetical protein
LTAATRLRRKAVKQLRFDRKAAHFLGAHFIVYALINLRHLLADEKSQ